MAFCGLQWLDWRRVWCLVFWIVRCTTAISLKGVRRKMSATIWLGSVCVRVYACVCLLSRLGLLSSLLWRIQLFLSGCLDNQRRLYRAPMQLSGTRLLWFNLSFFHYKSVSVILTNLNDFVHGRPDTRGCLGPLELPSLVSRVVAVLRIYWRLALCMALTNGSE